MVVPRKDNTSGAFANSTVIQWALTSLVCNLVLVSFMVETMRIWYLYAQAIATLIVAVASYFVYRFIFRS